jgi:hypothetical protein
MRPVDHFLIRLSQALPSARIGPLAAAAGFSRSVTAPAAQLWVLPPVLTPICSDLQQTFVVAPGFQPARASGGHKSLEQGS